MTPANPPELPYTVQKHAITRAETIHFECPACRDKLHAPLGDAGITDACPSCAGTFRVPGIEARRAADQRRASEEAKRVEVEAAWAKDAAKSRESLERLRTQAMAEYEAMVRQRPNRPHTTWCHRVGFVVFALGFIALILGLFSATTDGLSVVVSGSVLFIGGLLLAAVGSIGVEINRWGRAMTSRSPEPDPVISPHVHGDLK
jgi:hypothetical protein